MRNQDTGIMVEKLVLFYFISQDMNGVHSVVLGFYCVHALEDLILREERAILYILIYKVNVVPISPTALFTS